MVCNDLLSNMVAILNYGTISRKPYAVIWSNKLCLRVLELLYRNGYIGGYEKWGDYKVRVFLKNYDAKGSFYEIKRVSKPGCRIYVSYKDIKKIYKSGRIGIISTNKGLFTTRYLVMNNVHLGGEYLLFIR